MASVKKSITVMAPIEKVFDYLNDPTKLLEYWPGMLEVYDVQSLPNGGTRFNFVFTLAGFRVAGTSEDTEIVPNQRMVSKTTGGVDSTAIWDIEPAPGGTLVNFENIYVVPVPLLGKFAENVIVKLTDHEADTLMANLKVILESQAEKIEPSV